MNYDQYIGMKSNYGKIKSIWPQSGGFIILNTEDGSQFCLLASTIIVSNKEGFKSMIVRSDFTGVVVGRYIDSPNSLGGMKTFKIVCTFSGEKTEAEKQATDFIKAYNSHFSIITNSPVS